MEKCLVIYTVLNNIFRGYHMLCNRFTGEVVSHFVCLSYADFVIQIVQLKLFQLYD